MKNACKILEISIKYKTCLKERRESQMKKLYGTIMIHQQIMDKQRSIQEHIQYYKLKHKKFGLEIVKENEEKEKLERTNLMNITDSEEAINYVLNILINKKIMPNEEDIIHDLVKQYT